MLQAIINIEQYKVPDVAVLEVRHFSKELGHPYQRLVFFNKEVVRTKFNNQALPNFSKCLYGAYIDKPEQYKYIELSHYKEFLSNRDYNIIVCYLFELLTDFYQVKIVFPYICDLKDLERDLVNVICDLCITKSFIRKSFCVQGSISHFIKINRPYISNDVYTKLADIYNINK